MDANENSHEITIRIHEVHTGRNRQNRYTCIKRPVRYRGAVREDINFMSLRGYKFGTSFETAVEVLIQGMTVNEDKIKPLDWSQPNDIHGLDTASSEQLEPYLRFSKHIHFKYYDQGSGSQGERVNAWLRRRKNCKIGVRHADSIIESLPSDAWNTVPASSKRLKDEVYYILRCERAE
ncbi:hypothetical protein Tco_1176589 [Tanacetum coccineum]